MFRRFLTLAITIFVFVLTMHAQSDQKPVTNEDIATMLASKWMESEIVVKIQTSTTKFDTSIDAINQLKLKGATPKITEAMMRSTVKTNVVTEESINSQFDAIAKKLDSSPREMKESKDDFDFVLQSCKSAGSTSLNCNLRVKNTLDSTRTLRLSRGSKIEDDSSSEYLFSERYIGAKTMGYGGLEGRSDASFLAGESRTVTLGVKNLKKKPSKLNRLVLYFSSNQGNSYVEFSDIIINDKSTVDLKKK